MAADMTLTPAAVGIVNCSSLTLVTLVADQVSLIVVTMPAVTTEREMRRQCHCIRW